MATITIDYTTLCGKGIPAVNASGYGPILRQKVNCVLTPLLASKSYSLFKIPKGFVKRHAVVNVTTASAAATTLSVGSNQKDGSGNQIVYNATVALNAEASTLLDIDKPTETNDANVTAKTVAGDDEYLVIIPSANCADAKFEISLAGDFMLNPQDTNL